MKGSLGPRLSRRQAREAAVYTTDTNILEGHDRLEGNSGHTELFKAFATDTEFQSLSKMKTAISKTV